jgi:hypothetical protein
VAACQDFPTSARNATSVCLRCFKQYIEIVKCIGTIAVCLAGGLALNAGLRAASPASAKNPAPDNPYTTIADRNIFGLNPPAPPVPPEDPEKSLPKITPTGIQSVFGQSQVLFKVSAAPKPGPPVKDEFYILSQGQRQDDIEVIKIDETKGLVTFDNHGTTQELPLANAPATGAPAGSPHSPITMNPAFAPGPRGGGGNSSAGGIIQFGGGSGGPNGNMAAGAGSPGYNWGAGNNGGAGNQANSGMAFGNPAQASNLGPAAELPPIAPEDQQVIIVAQHLQAIKEGNPMAVLYPPTSLDKAAGIPPNNGNDSEPSAP